MKKYILFFLILTGCANYQFQEPITMEELRNKTWNFHNNNRDYDNIELGIGFCYWCGTRCSNSGGGWTVCVIFKDKSYGSYILPEGSKRPNNHQMDNEYTTDRIDTNNLTKL